MGRDTLTPTYVMMCDPPSGWKYGFPKVFNPPPEGDKETIKQWYIEEGYPKELVEQGMLKHVRYWKEEQQMK